MVELMNMPLSYISVLYDMALKKQLAAEADEKERERQEAQAIGDALEDELS